MALHGGKVILEVQVSKMALRNNREAAALVYNLRIIDEEEELLLLFDIKISKNPGFP